MVKRCVAFGCSNTSKLGFSLHEFPKSPSRRRQWEKFVQRRRASWAVGTSSYLCSQHFSCNQFHGGLEVRFGLHRRAKLVPTAVPDVPDSDCASFTASSAGRAAVHKLNKQRIIAELLEDTDNAEDTSGIEVTPELENQDVGVQTQPVSVRNRGIQATPVVSMRDVGVQCSLLCPEPEGKDMESEEEEGEEEEEEEEEEDEDEYFPTEEDCSDAESDDLEFDIDIPDDPEPEPPQEERKFIVFQSALLQLFAVCFACRAGDPTLRLETLGSFLRVIQSCTVCKSINTWCSQPLIGNTPAGNILMSAAILFAGAIPRQALHIFRHLKCQCVSARTFFRHQQINLQLAIQRVWLRKQEHLLQTAEEPLILGGDGRADSPGHSAKYGSYTMMDLRTNRILTSHLVQSNEVNGSNNMEKEGLIRNITELWARNLQINTIVTDRHLQVAKWIRENMLGTQHLYDVWHIAKGIRKKLNAIAREKDCAVIGLWVKSIVNHLYWSATSTREGQGDHLVAMTSMRSP